MKTFFGLIFAILFLTSCSDEAFNETDFLAGDGFTDSNIRVLQLDTLSVKFSTMKFDSIVTSDATRILLGEYTDPVFGEVKSSSYMELSPSSYSIDSEATFDSIVFILRYDNYYYNDTLSQNTIHLKPLSKKLKPDDDFGFYNTSKSAYHEEDIGTFTYTPRPKSGDSVNVRLNDSFGLDIFNNLQEKNITNYDEFSNEFFGITIQSDSINNGAVIGFKKESEMRLYYSIAEDTDNEQYFSEFTINTLSSPALFFNKIEVENPVDGIKELTNSEINLYSEDEEDLSYLQSGIGIATKMEFPHIKTLYDIQGQGTLLNAILRIKPKETSYDDALILRDTLGVFTVDKNNNYTGETSMIAILNRENQEFNDIYYEISMGSYLDNILITDQTNTEGLILLPYDYRSTIDRFVLDVNTENNGTQLEVTYTIYDENE